MRQAPGPDDDKIGHPILNHLGIVIRVSLATRRYLENKHYLRWNHRQGVYEFKRWVAVGSDKKIRLIELFQLMEGDSRRPKAYREVGPQLSGPNAVVCHCLRCRRLAGLKVEDEEPKRAEPVALSQAEIDAIKKRRRYS